MTIPEERTRAVVYTRAFLQCLIDPRKTPRVPRIVRREAAALLRHYPHAFDFDDMKRTFAKPNLNGYITRRNL